MYQTSQKWKENIYKNVQCAMNIYIDDVLINPNYIFNFKLGHNLFEKELEFGGTPSKYIEMQIYKEQVKNKPSTIKIEYGILINNALKVAEVNKMLVGDLNGIKVKSLSTNNSSFEMIQIGIFNIDDYTNNDDNTITIKALDNMVKFEFNYDGSHIKYPATLLEVLQDICNKAGVELGSTSFLNFDKEIAVYDNTVKAREYISYIAENAGGFAVIGRDGKLYIKEIYQDETEVPMEFFADFKWGEEYQISKVSYENGVESFKFGDDTRNNVWINQDNMYIVDEEQVEKIFNKVNGLTVNSFEGRTIIDPAVDVGDKLIIDGKQVIYQGEMTLEGRFIADINSIIDIKQKEETTVKVESQKVVNRRVQSSINEIDGNITQLVEEQDEQSQKLSKVEQDLTSITQEVSHIESFTKNTSGKAQLKIENAEEFPIINLEISGQTRKFDYRYPNETEYPSEDVYPQGSYTKLTLVIDKQSRTNISENARIYEIDMLEQLNNLDDICDKLVIEANTDKLSCSVKTVRYLEVKNDVIIKLAEPVETILNENLELSLFNGTNYIYLLEYPNWQMNARYMFKSDMNKYLATKVEMDSKITQTAEEINLEVRKKVDENEIISSINQSAEEIAIKAEKISLSGKTLNLADNMAIVSNKFNVDKDGNMNCSSANITGGRINLQTSRTLGDRVFNISDDMGAKSYIGTVNASIGMTGSDPFTGVYIQGRAGGQAMIYADSFNQNSSENIKKNIKLLGEGLKIVKDTDIYSYNLKTEKNSRTLKDKHIGFVIGDNYNTPEEIISNDGKSIDLYAMISVLWQAVKELTETFEKIKEDKMNDRNK